MPSDIVTAIRHHHQYELLGENLAPQEVKNLIALSLLVERAIQTFQSNTEHHEWEKGGELALQVLDLGRSGVEYICDELHERFVDSSR